MAINPQDMKRVKGMGFLLNRNTEQFSGRVITENGVLNAKQLKNLSEAAEKFGNGTVAFTSRLTVELPGIDYSNIENFQDYIAQENMVTGGTGAKVRPIVSCKGTTCVFGLYDTQALAKEIHMRFYEGYRDVALPHKFKIGVGGCPNNCIKPDLNDLGIVGQRVPKIQAELCNAVSQNETMYKVYIGGRWGKQIRIGTPLNKLFSTDEVLNMTEKAILFYKSRGIMGERFGTTIERMGMEEAEKILLSDELMIQKNEILKIK